MTPFGLARYFGLADPVLRMTEYRVAGQYKGRDGWADFSTTVEAENDSVAVEHTYASLGSRHGLKRMQIDIETVEEA